MPCGVWGALHAECATVKGKCILLQFPVPFLIVPIGSPLTSAVRHGNISPAMVLAAWLLGASIIGMLLGCLGVDSLAKRFRRGDLLRLRGMYRVRQMRTPMSDAIPPIVTFMSRFPDSASLGKVGPFRSAGGNGGRRPHHRDP